MPKDNINVRSATHGGSVADSGATWTCSCGKREQTKASYSLPAGWTKMVVYKGQPNGIDSIHEAIRCDRCSASPRAAKTPLRLSADTQAGLAELLKKTPR